MSTSELYWGIFWRMCLWGILAGAICGAIYGTILLPLIGSLFGAVIGGAMGLVLGILNGFNLSGLSIDQYYPLVNFEEYRRVTSVQNAVGSGISLAVVMAAVVYYPASVGIKIEGFTAFPVCVIIPALVGSVVAIAITRRVTHWYKRQFERVSPYTRLLDDWD